MKKKDLNLKESISVPCPVCKVAAGKRCQLFTGGLRFDPHVDRKFAAIAAIEENNVGRAAGRQNRERVESESFLNDVL